MDNKRRLSLGRQNEILLNEEHYNLFNLMKNLANNEMYLSDDILNKALWIDNTMQSDNGDLKFYNNGVWELLFKNRFKITDSITDSKKPTSPIPGQLWITNGVLCYFNGTDFTPVKAIPSEEQENNIERFKNFLYINPLKNIPNKIIDNFTNNILSMDKPLENWKENVEYKKGDITIYNKILYKCLLSHTSKSIEDFNRNDKWEKIVLRNQFLLPDAYSDKFFINGLFIPEKTERYDNGYSIDSSISISYPSDATIENKMISGIHVNPDRLKNITKKVILVDKSKESMVLEIPSNNTEFYGVRGGYGKLLLKASESENILSSKDGDYDSIFVNGKSCIELRPETVMLYDLIYCITYEFETNSILSEGKLFKKRFDLLNETSIYIGKTDNNICVFVDGLYLEESTENHKTYHYDRESGYIIFDSKLQDGNGPIKKYEVSVVEFPITFKFTIGIESLPNFNTYHGKSVYTIDFKENSVFKYKNFMAFINGVGLNNEAYEVVYDPFYEKGKFKDKLLIIGISPDDIKNAITFLEREVTTVDWKIDENNGAYYYTLNHNLKSSLLKPVGFDNEGSNRKLAFECVDENTIKIFSDDNFNGRITLINVKEDLQCLYCALVTLTNEDEDYNMWKGRVTSKKDPISGEVYIPIYVDAEDKTEDALHFDENEEPIVFIDGLYIFQKHLIRDKKRIKIRGLKEGQEAVVLGDTTNAKDFDEDSSDRILFEDSVSYTTIPLSNVDSTLVYVDNGILCDNSIFYQNIDNQKDFIDGQVYCEYDNIGRMIWKKYSGKDNKFIVIKDKEEIENLNCFSTGYASSKTSLSLLQNIKSDNCVSYSYRFCDNIEKKLQMGYCYADSISGVEKEPFVLNYKHNYNPGRHELSIFFDGIKQMVFDKKSKDYKDQYIKEDLNNGKYFYLSDSGVPIDKYDGFYSYEIYENNEFVENKFFDKNTSENELKIFEESILSNNKTFKKNEPKQNSIFYVVEGCERGEKEAYCYEYLTHKNALIENGAYPNNCYETKDILLTAGNLRLFINGIRQPYGNYERYENNKLVSHKAYSVLNQKVFQVQDVLLGSMAIIDSDCIYKNIDTILIETREDFSLKEKTIPAIHDNGKFYPFRKFDEDTITLPDELFNSRDNIMIYIDGLAYGNNYYINKENGNKYIELLNKDVCRKIDATNLITFEWR